MSLTNAIRQGTKTLRPWFDIKSGTTFDFSIKKARGCYFYDKNKVKVGKKGPNGDMGPRGFKGKSQICSSCGLAGKKETIYAGSINDFGEKITDNSKITSDGEKCVFPFVHNYSYKYKPVKDDSPPGQTKNDAHDVWPNPKRIITH